MAELVLYTRDDAVLAKTDRPASASAVLGLTPNARVEAATLGLRIIEPTMRYSDARQAWDVARVVRVRRRMLRGLGPLPAIERELVLDHFNRVAYSALRLWHLLGNTGPWIVPVAGRFLFESDRTTAFALLLDHILVPKIAAEGRAAVIRTPPLPGLYRTLRRAALWRHRATDICVALGVAKEQFGLFDALARQGKAVRTLYVGLPQRGIWEYAKLAREALRNLRPGGRVQVMLTTKTCGPERIIAQRAVDATRDPVIRTAFAHYVPIMGEKLGHLTSARRDAERVLEIARPGVFTAAEISTYGNWIVAEAAGKAGIPRIVMSRNAHAPADRRLARDSAVGYLRSRVPTDLVDEALFWSPIGLRAAEEAMRPSAQPRLSSFCIGKPDLSLSKRPTRTVLLADSYAAWWYPHSWIFLNGDEFIAAAAALVTALSTIANSHLVIRVKPKPECDYRALKELLPPSGNSEIKMRDGDFAKDLGRADLLVAFHSSTVLEAIGARRPVLLWGGTSRHSYSTARESLPSANDRSALYGVVDAAKLAPMVAAILDAHAGRPLTDLETAPFRWQQDAWSVDELCSDLFNRACLANSRPAKASASYSSAHKNRDETS